MALCCRGRRKKSDPIPDSQEFKPFTPDYLHHVNSLTEERVKRTKEFKKRRKAVRHLRKRIEAGEDVPDDDPDILHSRRCSVASTDPEAAAHEEDEVRLEKENKKLEKTGPNKRMEAGRALSPKYAADFHKHLAGTPLIDIDPYYKEKPVFIVLGRDKTIYRFSAHKALFCMTPFSPVRRAALYTLVHPYFNLIVMLTILTNCVFMAITETEENKDVIKIVEYVFTAIYTFEFLVKFLARGFIMEPFTYLRDAWNWLDFMVISLAYVMLLVENTSKPPEPGQPDQGSALENVSVLRTFRVLRALKTVAVIPGLKTIVGALMEAVINLRDVGILTAFVLSIFALIGLQLYQGSLKYRCVAEPVGNLSEIELVNWINNESNWFDTAPEQQICGDALGAGTCVAGYHCNQTNMNPNFGYTGWDDFFSCMLNSFRIMTQDYWENLYFITIRANGMLHFFFFVIFILLGSFYLINLILAIVAMAYNDQQERDLKEQMAELNEKKEEQNRHLREACAQVRGENAQSRPPSRVPSLERLLSPKPFVATDRVSLRTEFEMDNPQSTNKNSLSLPGSPSHKRRWGSIGSLVYNLHQGTVRERAITKPEDGNGRVAHYVPFADDSQAQTPSSIDGPLMFDYATPQQQHEQINKYENRALRLSLRSRASIKSRHGSRRDNTIIPSRAFPPKQADDQNNIPLEEVTEERLLPDNDTPDEYRSLVSLDSHSAGNNINMKGVQDIREMRDIANRAKTIDSRKPSSLELFKAQFVQRCCAWKCCPCFLNFQKYLDLFINDAFMEVFIMLCILCNTTFMAMDKHPKEPAYDNVLSGGNYFFTAVFTFECLLKLIALGPVKYFREPWNSFDFVVVAFSLVELSQELAAMVSGDGGQPAVEGLSVLRSLRLLRVLKLAKSWKTLNQLMQIVGRALGALGNLSVILGIVIFIFAVCGTQLFSEKYEESRAVFTEEGGLVPRWNFKDFLHGFMIVFRVLCGEWIESMWNCMRVGQTPICVPFFLLTYIIGNAVVLNLFLVLLLSSFSVDALDSKAEDEDDVDKISQAKGRIVRLVKYIKKRVMETCCARRLKKQQQKEEEMALVKTGNGTNGIIFNKDDSIDGPLIGEKDNKAVDTPLLSDYERMEMETSLVKISDPPIKESNHAGQYANSNVSSVDNSLDDAEALVNRASGIPGNPEFTEVEVEYETLPADCLCAIVNEKLPSCPDSRLKEKFWALRCFMFRLVEHKYFETFIIVCILLSSVSLALEDKYLPDKPNLELALNYIDKIFSGIFICEMIIKFLAFGWRVYFTDAWCWLDFVIVGISITSLILESLGLNNISAFKAMRTLRALRPLRAVSRWEGMRVVVNALIQAVPAISNVLVVILLFWLIFAIMGVNFFAGKFWKCVDMDGNFLHVIHRENDSYYVREELGITNKTTCEQYKDKPGYNFEWKNSEQNFDNVFRAYLALLQVATYKGWIEIMADATDSKKENENPVYEANVIMYLYFVGFIVFGSFFTLNMFIGVIIENFNAQKKKAGGSIEMFMTEDQKKYYNAMKKLSGKGPAKATPRPKWKIQGMIYDFTMNQKFDVAIMVFILLNMITMCMDYDGQPPGYTEVLDYVNLVFIVVFTMESILKILALRQYYFTFPWNVFDFVVVLFSIIGLAFKDVIEQHLNLSPTVLRVVRVFRVGRVLRLVKSAKGIRTLLFSLLVSLPALFNIGLLLFLVIFIYSTFGMAFFKDVEHHAGIDEVFNFETFFRSLMTLFQCTTSAGWNSVLRGITNVENCTKETTAQSIKTCGDPQVGVIYMVTYLLFTFLVIINMYIAVILENFSQATEDVQQGITGDDIEMYYEVWGTYDPKATKYIKVDKLFNLVDELEEPLRVPKPNYFRLVMTDLPVCEGDRIHCNDILDMLTKLFLNQDFDPNANEGLPQNDLKEKYGDDYKPIYGLLERQRHKWAARFIWKRYLAYRERHGRPVDTQSISSASLKLESEWSGSLTSANKKSRNKPLKQKALKTQSSKESQESNV